MGDDHAAWLIVFVKAPTPGQVKTRLAPLLTSPDAAAFYRCLVQDTLAVATRLRGVNVVVAYAADRTFPNLAWLDALAAGPGAMTADRTSPHRSGFPSEESVARRNFSLASRSLGTVPAQNSDVRLGGSSVTAHHASARTIAPRMFLQQGQTLGDRLAQAFRWAFKQNASRVLVIGSDAPDLATAWLRQAFQALRETDVVLGPTTDGGYHLIGLTRPHPDLFADMPWSTPKVFDQTLQRIGRLGLGVRCLEAVTDLDAPEDVHRYLEATSSRRRRTRTAGFLRQYFANRSSSRSSVVSP